MYSIFSQFFLVGGDHDGGVRGGRQWDRHGGRLGDCDITGCRDIVKVAMVIEMVMIGEFDTEITKQEADNVTHVPQGWVSSSSSIIFKESKWPERKKSNQISTNSVDYQLQKFLKESLLHKGFSQAWTTMCCYRLPAPDYMKSHW